MRRLVQCGILTVLCGTATQALGLESVADSIEFNVSGLVARTVCTSAECFSTQDPDGGPQGPGPHDWTGGSQHDALGQWYVADAFFRWCPEIGRSATESRVFRFDRDGNNTLVARIPAICTATTYTEFDIRKTFVDPIAGTLTMFVASYERDASQGAIASESSIVEVAGLPSVFDILLSYQPPSTLSFNVPVRPEGLPGADSFSVYHGDVRTASNLSQATPFECTVPAGRPPVPGEHLTVADPLPDPAPGDARYYVAAVSYQGQRRAGRTSMSGVLQGRKAAALVSCQ